MPDLDKLRSLGDRIQPPALARLEETARRRDRRAALTTVSAGLATVLIVAGGAVTWGMDRDDRTLPDPITPVSPTPTPQVTPTPTPDQSPTHSSETSMSPAEVVHADNAEFLLGGVSADDPDFRMSVWTAECTWCPKDYPDAQTRPYFNAMAVTTDGWQTATYQRPPMGAGRPFYVHSPAPGVLLVVDHGNGGEWLVREDASAVRLARVVEDRPASEPRRWFPCYSGGEEGTWCALDLESEVVYEWGGAWEGAAGAYTPAVSPGSGVEPWGHQWVESGGGGLDAWWYQDGVRRTRNLVEPEPAPQRAGAALGANEGDLVYWAYRRGDTSMQFFVGDDLGATWRTIEQTYPAEAVGEVEVLVTPGGAVLMRSFFDAGSGNARTRLWRLDSLEAGTWTLVHDTGNIAWEVDTGNMRHLTVIGDLLVSGTLQSDDDGRTWTTVDRWR